MHEALLLGPENIRAVEQGKALDIEHGEEEMAVVNVQNMCMN
jgi:phosphoribosylformylglycinamidine (FGAM) synthase PurS component